MFRSSVWLGQIQSFHDFPMCSWFRAAKSSSLPRTQDWHWSCHGVSTKTPALDPINDPRLHLSNLQHRKSAARKPLITLSAGLYLPHLQDVQWWNAWKLEKDIQKVATSDQPPATWTLPASARCWISIFTCHISSKNWGKLQDGWSKGW